MSEAVVVYFAVLREQRGCDQESVAITVGETVSSLYARLFPAGPEGRVPVGFACNQAHVGADHPVQAGDEVAFLPPLGGG